MNSGTQMKSEVESPRPSVLTLARSTTTLASIKVVLSLPRIRRTTWAADRTVLIFCERPHRMPTVETIGQWLSPRKASTMLQRIHQPFSRPQSSQTSKSNAILQWVAHQAIKRVRRVTAELLTNRSSDGSSPKFNEAILSEKLMWLSPNYVTFWNTLRMNINFKRLSRNSVSCFFSEIIKALGQNDWMEMINI